MDIIQIIYDRYIHTNDGINGVANYLNNHGYTKKLRQNGTIPGFSSSFVKAVLDNPIYMGKIAYGRRKIEKINGTRNEMHVVEQADYPVYEGKHEAIISEEDWNLANLNQAETIKTRLEKQMDTLDVTNPHYERKINDLQKRLDAHYDIIEEAENAVEEIRFQIRDLKELKSK